MRTADNGKTALFDVTAVWNVYTLSQIELSLLSQLQFSVYAFCEREKLKQQA